MVFALQSCCMSESDLFMTNSISVKTIICMKSNLDTFYKIGYPNSSVEFSSKATSHEIYLSEANDNTTIYISSSKGLDTIIVKNNQEITFKPATNFDDEYLKFINYKPTLLKHTFDSCYFNNYIYKNSEIIYDSLFVL